MKQRVITATIFALAMLAGVYGGPYTFFLLFFAVAAGCLWELMSLLFPASEPFSLLRRITGSVMGILPFLLYVSAILFNWHTVVLAGDYHFPSPGGNINIDAAPYWLVTFVITLIELLLMFFLLILELFLASDKPFPNVGNYLLGIFYIGVPLVLLIESAFWTGGYGPHRVFGLMWLVWTNDVAAFVLGSAFGRTKLFERISPKKTWEGFMGGVGCSLIMAWILSLFIDEYTLAQWIGLAVVVGIFGTLGDLVESMLKRSAAVKDSGEIFPGHGGFLDRYDAFLFVQPFVWLMLMLLEALG